MGRRAKPLKHGSIRGASLQVRSARTRAAGLVLVAIDSQSRQLAASVPCVSNEVRGKAQQPLRVQARVGMRSSVLLGRGPCYSFGQCITETAPGCPAFLNRGGMAHSLFGGKGGVASFARERTTRQHKHIRLLAGSDESTSR